MKYISLFSGIEAATVAFEPLGWSAVCFSEIEPFPSAVLHHHYPGIPNVGDVLKHDWSQYKGQVDVMVGGPPCQAFSVAGLRESLQDDRGNLSLAWARAIEAVEPRYAITENVPGWLSTKDNAFGCFLGAIVGADAALVLAKGQRWTDAGMVVGPKRAAAWRVLDAQHFGLAQRRRRVFVVCCPRNGANPAAVLFERESLSGHPAPRREAREVSTADAGSGVAVGGGEVAPTLSRRYSYDRGDGAEPLVTCYDAHLTAGWKESEIAAPIRQNTGGGGESQNAAFVLAHGQANAEVVRDGSPSLSCNHEAPIVAMPMHDMTTRHAGTNGSGHQTGKGHGLGIGDKDDPMFTLSSGDKHMVAYGIDEECNGDGRGGTHQAVAFTCSEQANSYAWERDVAPTLDAQIPNDTSNIQKGIRQGMTVRRLTPRECERLQGFEDDYTAIPWRGKAAADCPDGPRYKALGNSMAVPVMRWIGERIAMVEEVTG